MMTSLMKVVASLLFLLVQGCRCNAWVHCSPIPRSPISVRLAAKIDDIPEDLQVQIQDVAKQLWGQDDLELVMSSVIRPIEGEATFTGDTFETRLDNFLQRAREGDPHAQHSSGLLLWSGFCGQQDDIESAKWHAAAAAQGHLDSIAIIGGCLRKGAGIKRNVALGLDVIRSCASIGNPTGINKQVALLEERDDLKSAFEHLETCIATGRANSLVYFNLGYFLVHGEKGGAVELDESRGEEMWRKAIDLAPDEGSEEAAYFLSRQAFQPAHESIKLLHLAAELGYPEAVEATRDQWDDE
jgi:TPR repeat protein